MTETTLRTDILPVSQQRIWLQLSPVSQLGFVLYGGTSLALQLGHRTSADFDFFSSRTFQKKDILDILPFCHTADIEQQVVNTLSLRTQDDVRISFFGGISFGRVGIPLTCADNGVQLASLDDLMATTLKVLFDRWVSRDYADLAALLRAGVSLAKGLASASKMFGNRFAPIIALKAMTCFKDGDLHKVSAEDRAVLIAASRKVSVLPQGSILSWDLSAPAQGPEETDECAPGQPW